MMQVSNDAAAVVSWIRAAMQKMERIVLILWIASAAGVWELYCAYNSVVDFPESVKYGIYALFVWPIMLGNVVGEFMLSLIASIC